MCGGPDSVNWDASRRVSEEGCGVVTGATCDAFRHLTPDECTNTLRRLQYLLRFDTQSETVYRCTWIELLEGEAVTSAVRAEQRTIRGTGGEVSIGPWTIDPPLVNGTIRPIVLKVDITVDASDPASYEMDEVNGVDQVATVKGTGTTVLKAVLTPDTPEIRALINWEGATEDPNDPTKATVPRTSSIKQDVSVLVDGHSCRDGVVWVLWADLDVRHSGNKTPWDLNDVGNKAEFSPFVEGISHQLGPTDRLTETPPYLGHKVEIKATITPEGAGAVVVDDWAFQQTVSYVIFMNSTNVTDSGTDEPDSGDAFDDTPDINDNVFSLDAPGLVFLNGLSGFSRAKTALNFTVVLKWKGTICSDETYWWTKLKLEYDGSTCNVLYNEGGDGSISLPTAY